MKKLLTTLSLLCVMQMTNAQTMQDVANSSTLKWYGIDYSEAHFLNFGAYLSDKVVRTNMPRWSFDPFGGDYHKEWKKKYKKETLDADTNPTRKRNQDADFDAHMGTEPFEMSEEDVKKLVASYDDIEGTGYGLMYVVESFNNVGKVSNIWAVVFNEKDRTVINATRYEAETFGDWAEGVRITVKKHARDLAKAK